MSDPYTARARPDAAKYRGYLKVIVALSRMARLVATSTPYTPGRGRTSTRTSRPRVSNAAAGTYFVVAPQ